MVGLAETSGGLAAKLVRELRIGDYYTVSQMEENVGWLPGAGRGKGVFSPAGANAQLFFITLEKDKYHTKGYVDHLNEDSCTLFWTGQLKLKTAEEALLNGKRDTFIFIRKVNRQPFVYYGRAIPIRHHVEWERGKLSHFVFDLPEYAHEREVLGMDPSLSLGEKPANSEYIYDMPTQKETTINIRIAQGEYRRRVLSLWDSKCAVTGVDNPNWLIASHIKPWRESDNTERVDANNSLLLAPHYDKLFDRGVISFSPDDGRIILPETQSRQMWNNLSRLHITEDDRLRMLNDNISSYLEYHNQYVYQFEPDSTDITTDNLLEDLVYNYSKHNF